LDIRQFRHIAALAEHRHFGRAADAVGITQAALTQSIQKIEEAYGVPLFERRHGDVAPTAYGEIVIETARFTIAKVQNTRRQIRLMQKLAAGRLLIGCDPYFAEPIVTPALIRLLNDYPKLEFTLELGGWESLQERLIARDLDIYIGFPYEPMDARITTEDHVLPPFVVFGRAGHEIMSLPRVTPSDVFKHPIVAPKASQWLRHRLQKLYQPTQPGEGRRLPAYLLTTDFAIIRQVVQNSDALAAAMPRAISADVASGALVQFRLPEFEFDIPLVIASPAKRSASPAAEALVDEVRKEITLIAAEAAESRQSGG
jgi:DNA-binding transcriptional LysR family regulator